MDFKALQWLGALDLRPNLTPPRRCQSAIILQPAPISEKALVEKVAESFFVTEF